MRLLRAVGTLAVMLALLTTACGGQDASTPTTSSSKVTTTVDPVTTAPADTTIATDTTAPSPTTTVETEETSTTPAHGLAPECVDAIRAHVQDLDPVVSGFDFAGASFDEHYQLEADLQPALFALVDRWITAQCPEIAEVFPPELENELIDFAEKEVPGSVVYVKLNYAEVRFEGGDCDESLAALRGYVDQGGVYGDLPAADKANVFRLWRQLTSRCGLQTGDEVLNAFLETGS